MSKMERAAYIGIDPGQSGGLVLMNVITKAIKLDAMPGTERDVWDWIRWASGASPFAIIESVHAMPGNGVSSMFKFGKGYGGVRMALIAAGIPFEEVTPQAWQKVFGMGRKKGEEKRGFKKRLRAKAQQLFPKETVTDETADALLIAEYARRKMEGKL